MRYEIDTTHALDSEIHSSSPCFAPMNWHTAAQRRLLSRRDLFETASNVEVWKCTWKYLKESLGVVYGAWPAAAPENSFKAFVKLCFLPSAACYLDPDSNHLPA